MAKQMLKGINKEVVVYLEEGRENAKIKTAYSKNGEVQNRRFYFNGQTVNIMLMVKPSMPQSHEIFVADKKGVLVPPMWVDKEIPCPQVFEANSLEEVKEILSESSLKEYLQ